MRQGSLCTNYAVTDMPTEKHATNCCVLRVQAVAKGHFFPPVLTQKAGLTQVWNCLECWDQERASLFILNSLQIWNRSQASLEICCHDKTSEQIFFDSYLCIKNGSVCEYYLQTLNLFASNFHKDCSCIKNGRVTLAWVREVSPNNTTAVQNTASKIQITGLLGTKYATELFNYIISVPPYLCSSNLCIVSNT